MDQYQVGTTLQKQNRKKTTKLNKAYSCITQKGVFFHKYDNKTIKLFIIYVMPLVKQRESKTSASVIRWKRNTVLIKHFIKGNNTCEKMKRKKSSLQLRNKTTGNFFLLILHTTCHLRFVGEYSKIPRAMPTNFFPYFYIFLLFEKIKSNSFYGQCVRTKNL